MSNCAMSREIFCVVSLFCLSFSTSFPIPEDVPSFSSQPLVSQPPNVEASSPGEQQLAVARLSLEQAAEDHEKNLLKKSSLEPSTDLVTEEPPQEVAAAKVPAKEQSPIITAAESMEEFKAQPVMASPASMQQQPLIPIETAAQPMPMMPVLQAPPVEMTEIQAPPAVEKPDQEVPQVSVMNAPAAPIQAQTEEEKHVVLCTSLDRPKDKFQLASSCSTDPSQN